MTHQHESYARHHRAAGAEQGHAADLPPGLALALDHRGVEAVGVEILLEAGFLGDSRRVDGQDFDRRLLQRASPVEVLREAAGLGLRYYTAIGPLRVDFAVPAKNNVPGNDSFQMYIGLGQAF